MSAADVAAASLWATVPGYTAQIPSPKACEALMRGGVLDDRDHGAGGRIRPARIADYSRHASRCARRRRRGSRQLRHAARVDDGTKADDDADEDDDTDEVTAEVDRFDGDEEVEPSSSWPRSNGACAMRDRRATTERAPESDG